jgi:hypothetical protein
MYHRRRICGLEKKDRGKEKDDERDILPLHFC